MQLENYGICDVENMLHGSKAFSGLPSNQESFDLSIYSEKADICTNIPMTTCSELCVTPEAVLLILTFYFIKVTFLQFGQTDSDFMLIKSHNKSCFLLHLSMTAFKLELWSAHEALISPDRMGNCGFCQKLRVFLKCNCCDSQLGVSTCKTPDVAFTDPVQTLFTPTYLFFSQ